MFQYFYVGKSPSIPGKHVVLSNCIQCLGARGSVSYRLYGAYDTPDQPLVFGASYSSYAVSQV